MGYRPRQFFTILSADFAPGGSVTLSCGDWIRVGTADVELIDGNPGLELFCSMAQVALSSSSASVEAADLHATYVTDVAQVRYTKVDIPWYTKCRRCNIKCRRFAILEGYKRECCHTSLAGGCKCQKSHIHYRLHLMKIEEERLTINVIRTTK